MERVIEEARKGYGPTALAEPTQEVILLNDEQRFGRANVYNGSDIQKNPDGSLQIYLPVTNKYGIHARPAAKIINYLKSLHSDTEVVFEKGDGTRVSGKSILDMLTFTATSGTQLTVTAIGSDSRVALNGLVELFKSKFGEE